MSKKQSWYNVIKNSIKYLCNYKFLWNSIKILFFNKIIYINKSLSFFKIIFVLVCKKKKIEEKEIYILYHKTYEILLSKIKIEQS